MTEKTSPQKKKMDFSPRARRRARQCALQALYQWSMAGGDAKDIELQFKDAQNMTKVDVPYFEGLLHGVISQIDKIDQAFTPHLDRPFEQLTPIELAILRVATFELTERKDVPAKVIADEAVELAKDYGAQDGYKFVNGIIAKLIEGVGRGSE